MLIPAFEAHTAYRVELTTSAALYDAARAGKVDPAISHDGRWNDDGGPERARGIARGRHDGACRGAIRQGGVRLTMVDRVGRPGRTCDALEM